MIEWGSHLIWRRLLGLRCSYKNSSGEKVDLKRDFPIFSRTISTCRYIPEYLKICYIN